MFKKIKNSNTFFVVLLLLLLVAIAVMHYLDSFLITLSSPNGIVSFELAKESYVSVEMIDAWDVKAKVAAGLSLGFDFLFLLIYASFISLLIVKVNKLFFLKKNTGTLEKVIVILPFVAAFFDVIENILLIKLLLGDIQVQWSLMAYYAAMIKFGLLLIAIVYIIVGGVVLAFRKTNKTKMI